MFSMLVRCCLVIASARALFTQSEPAQDVLHREAPQGKKCAMTVTYERDVAHAVSLLKDVNEKAMDKDTHPFFVVVTSQEEATKFQAAAAGSQALLAPHKLLTLEGIAPDNAPADPSGEAQERGNLANIMRKVNNSRDSTATGCTRASGTDRFVGHIKKFYGVRHLTLKEGCDFVWVMDCESMPLRKFTYEEVFSRIGAVWVHDPRKVEAARASPLARYADLDIPFLNAYGQGHEEECMSAAEKTHNQLLSREVRNMQVRQNDFWLFEGRLVVAMMEAAVRYAPPEQGLPPTATFLDAFSRAGQNSEQIVWSSWLVQRVMDGSIEMLKPRVKYHLVTFVDHLKEFINIFPESMMLMGTDSARLSVQQSANLYDFMQWAMPDMKELGRFWYDTLGQAGFIGDMLKQASANKINMADFVSYVPWCVSNCRGIDITRAGL